MMWQWIWWCDNEYDTVATWKSVNMERVMVLKYCSCCAPKRFTPRMRAGDHIIIFFVTSSYSVTVMTRDARLEIYLLYTSERSGIIMMMWQWIWWCDNEYDDVTSHAGTYEFNEVTTNMKIWQRIRSCGNEYDDVTMNMMMWQWIWWCDNDRDAGTHEQGALGFRL